MCVFKVCHFELKIFWRLKCNKGTGSTFLKEYSCHVYRVIRFLFLCLELSIYELRFICIFRICFFRLCGKFSKVILYNSFSFPIKNKTFCYSSHSDLVSRSLHFLSACFFFPFTVKIGLFSSQIFLTVSVNLCIYKGGYVRIHLADFSFILRSFEKRKNMCGLEYQDTIYYFLKFG